MTKASNMSPGSRVQAVVRSPKNGKARATNHRDLLPRVADGRASAARRFRDLVRAFISDAGGIENCSEVKLGLLRRLAAVTVLAEEVESKAVNGEAIDIATLCTLASTSMRLSSRLGIERVPRDVGPTLSDLIKQDWADQANARGTVP